MNFFDILKTAVGVGTSVTGATASQIAGTAVSIPGSVIDKNLSTIPAVVAVPGEIIKDVAGPVLSVLTPKKSTPKVTAPQIEAPKPMILKVPGYEEGTDKTTGEEIMELLPMGGLALLAFLL